MPTTTATILDQISAEKTKVSERLARLDADRAEIATQLTELEPDLPPEKWAPGYAYFASACCGVM